MFGGKGWWIGEPMRGQLIGTRVVSLLCPQVRSLSQKNNGDLPSSRHVRPAKGFRKVFTNYFFKFVGSYEELLQKKFPKAYEIYRIFTTGSRDLYRDIMEYTRISSELSYGRKVRDLTYQELLVYYQTPKDLMKVWPTLTVSLLPFANYVVFPLAIMYPKLLLSQQFWSPEQRFNFRLEAQIKRLKHNRPLFRQLQGKLNFIPQYISDEHFDIQKQCKHIFDKIGSGTHPSIEEILSVKPVFVGSPFGIRYLPNSHLLQLCKVHSLSSWPRKRPRLINYGDYLFELDAALLRAGGPDILSDDQMRDACFTRGLNPFGCDRDFLTAWLNQWLTISKNLRGSSLSLLLHCPLFLGYNQPSNWKLIYSAKTLQIEP